MNFQKYEQATIHNILAYHYEAFFIDSFLKVYNIIKNQNVNNVGDQFFADKPFDLPDIKKVYKFKIICGEYYCCEIKAYSHSEELPMCFPIGAKE